MKKIKCQLPSLPNRTGLKLAQIAVQALQENEQNNKATKLSRRVSGQTSATEVINFTRHSIEWIERSDIYINFSQNELITFIKEMTKEKALNIGLSELTYYRLKDNPKYIEKTQSSTLLKILEAMPQIISKTEARIVGIDVNKKDYIAAATPDLNITYSSGVDTSVLYEKYDNLDKQERHNILQEMTAPVINKLFKRFKTNQPIVFVIGRFNTKNDNVVNAKHKMICHIIRDKMGPNDQIIMIDENRSSQRCPKCNHIDEKHRTSTNKFKCKQCDFKHINDDIVAACNHANAYLKQNGIMFNISYSDQPKKERVY